MEELLTEKFLKEVQDRVGDAVAAMELLTPLVAREGSGKGQEYLSAMNKSFYRLIRLIHHVEVCKTQSVIQGKTLDLAGLCRKLSRDSEDMAKILGTAFDWELSDSSVISVGDDHLLELAILNLLVNAFEAAGPEGKVSFKSMLENGRWIMTVEDNGLGLRESEESGDPFLKAPGGVGLGLEAARRAAELHGGVLMLVDKGAGGDLAGECGVKAVLSLPIRKPEGDAVVKEPAYELRGGFCPALVEFSPILPAKSFFTEDTK